MFKENLEGKTNYCNHETPNTSGICDRCLGKVNFYPKAEILGQFDHDIADKMHGDFQLILDTKQFLSDSLQKYGEEKYQEGINYKIAYNEVLESYKKELIEKIGKEWESMGIDNYEARIFRDSIIKLINL